MFSKGGLSFDFRYLGRALDTTLKHYTAALLKKYLVEKGYPIEKLEVKVGVILVYRGRGIEIDLFNEDPLVIGEVTMYIGSIEEARDKVDKLLEKVKVVEEIYGRSVELKILAVANLEHKVVEVLENLADRYGLMIITGREVEYPR